MVRRGEVHALVRAVDAGWRVQRLEVRDLEVVATPRPVFHDVSRQVGVSLGRTRYTDDALHAQLEVLELSTIGGLGVADSAGATSLVAVS